ncbi:alpha/beta fold hydrolase [Massilia cavernae]|uniref:Alpha/beta hydrolase n=1 Tax=Massilia cavernae TaxID=2320864 RepID=A0A418Y5J8_9BURK|nr:alpha/beta hydrolase [Massilia cavernae]RJG21926.1 alpha/beta hydrolase [Massilia cavernae]
MAAPAERFDVGSMLVERHGQRGRPLVLIPGLGSGPWAWKDTVREYSGDYTVYVVTLPGFDGRPAVAGAGFDSARDALKQLIATRKIDKPVLIGHSMGGALALAVAAQLLDQVGGVVAVDGLPIFPTMENLPREQRSMMAQIAALNAPAFAAQQAQTGITPQAKAAYYTSLMAGTAKLEVVPVEGARHFVMFDQPRQVSDAIGRFLKVL